MRWYIDPRWKSPVYDDRPIHPDTLRLALWFLVFTVVLVCVVVTCLKHQF